MAARPSTAAPLWRATLSRQRHASGRWLSPLGRAIAPLPLSHSSVQAALVPLGSVPEGSALVR